MPLATISPSTTTSAPTGTLPRSPAARASSSARRIQSSCEPCIRTIFRLGKSTLLLRRVCGPGLCGRRSSAPERIRTSDPRFRRPVLYPAELRVQKPAKRMRPFMDCQAHNGAASDLCVGGADAAEREGFEPSVELLTLHSLSRRAPSATRPPLHIRLGRFVRQIFKKLSRPAFWSLAAEEEGFEPSRLSPGGFQDRCLQPLGHSSIGSGAKRNTPSQTFQALRVPLWK